MDISTPRSKNKHTWHMILLGLWWHNLSRVVETKFNEFCVEIRSIIAKNARKTPWTSTRQLQKRYFFTLQCATILPHKHLTLRVLRQIFCSLQNLLNLTSKSIRPPKVLPAQTNHVSHQWIDKLPERWERDVHNSAQCVVN